MFDIINVGRIDGSVRVILAAVLIAIPMVTNLAIWDNALFSISVPVIGVVIVLTAIFRFCPIYRALGMKTCKI